MMYRLGVVVSFLLLVSCHASPPAAPTLSPSQSSQTLQRTSLILWHAWPLSDQYILTNLIQHYHQTHPEIEIILQSMPYPSLTTDFRTATMTGRGPDLIILPNHLLEPLAKEHSILPLDDMLTPSDYISFISTTIQGAEVQQNDGTTHVYGLPLIFDTLVLYYHKAYQNQPPTTMDDLLIKAHELFDATKPLSFCGFAYTLSFDKTISYLPAFGGSLFDAQGNVVLGTQGRFGVERWLQWMLDLHQDQKILAVSDGMTVDYMIKSQKVLMTIDWAHALPTYQSLWGEHLGVALLPQMQEAAPQPYVQSHIISINAQVMNHNKLLAAQDFLRYLISVRTHQIFLEAGKQPALLTVNLEADGPFTEIARVFRMQAQQGQAMPNTIVSNDIVRDEIERMQITVLRGLSIPADAVTQTDRSLRHRLEKRTSFYAVGNEKLPFIKKCSRMSADDYGC